MGEVQTWQRVNIVPKRTHKLIRKRQTPVEKKGEADAVKKMMAINKEMKTRIHFHHQVGTV